MRTELSDKMVILAVSDTHVGSPKSSIDAFEAFLKEVICRSDVDTVVFLGDCFDMWVRDVSGLFFENYKIVELLATLKQKKTVHYIVGNHDYHLLHLKGYNYPISFEKDLTIQKDGVTYVFRHGWEFDDEQSPPVMEALCDNLSDAGGQVLLDIWNRIKSYDQNKDQNTVENVVKRNSGKLETFEFVFESLLDAYLQRLKTPASARVSTAFSNVEVKAAENVRNGELLVFGHTHRPFVSPTQNLVNTGSWVSDEKIYNTWVEIEGKNVLLMQYGVGDITHAFIKKI